MPDEELKIPALGRPAFLGQLYDATTGRLLNDSLFPASATIGATKTSIHEHLDVEYHEVKSSEDRAESLDINASVSVSLMGGLLKLSGEGSYLDRTESQQDAVTVSGMVRAKTEHWRLEVNDEDLQGAVLITEEKLQKIGATHAVTAITYGGSLIGSVTESNYRSKESTDVNGKFSLDLAQDFGFLAGASGEAKFNSTGKKVLSNYNMELRLLGDYLSPGHEAKIPVTLGALNKRIIEGPSLLNFGIPVELTLTPRSFFNRFSTELLYNELHEAELHDIVRFYDELVALSQDRLFLLDQIDQNGGEFFSSLRMSCQASHERVDLFTLEARTSLGVLLRSCRNGSIPNPSEALTMFLKEKQHSLDQELALYEKDSDRWKTLSNWKVAAENGDFRFMTAQELSIEMDSISLNSIAVVILPVDALQTQVLNLYRGLYASVNDVHGKLGLSNKVVCCTIFADEAIWPDLLLLDGQNGAVQVALDTAHNTSKAQLLTYRLSRNPLGLEEWRSSEQVGWGLIDDPIENTRYVGELKNGLPHGIGVMTYSGETGQKSYSGTWFYGKRDGRGEMRDASDIIIEQGIYVDNVRQDDARLINVTVYRNDIPIDTATVAVVAVAPIVKDEEPIDADVKKWEAEIQGHVEKFARAFGWKSGQRHKLRTTWSYQQYWRPPGGEHVDGSTVPLPFWPTCWSAFTLDTNGDKIEKLHYDPEGYWYFDVWSYSCWLEGYAAFRDADGNWLHKNVREFGVPVNVEALVLEDGASDGI